MQQLFTFRLEIAKLNDEQFMQFTNQWKSLLNREVIVLSIFYYFLSRKKVNETASEYNLSTINQSIADIIESAKKNKRKSEEAFESKPKTKPIITLQSLPSDIIGNMASFLSQTSYINLEKCSRQIYISCNAPCTLQQLYLRGDADRDDILISDIIYRNINIRTKYPLIKHLEVDFYFNHYLQMLSKSYTNPQPWSHLKSLHLYLACLDGEIELFNKYNTLIQMDNIETFYFESYSGTASNFYKVLANLKRVRELTCQYISFERTNLDQFNGFVLPQLLSFEFIDRGYHEHFMIINDVIKSCGHHLQSITLRLQRYKQCAVFVCNILQNISFPKLTDLTITDIENHTVLNAILKKSSSLRRFKLIRDRNTRNYMDMNELETLIIALIKRQSSLECAVFDVENNNVAQLHCIATQIINNQTKNTDRRTFEIFHSKSNQSTVSRLTIKTNND